MLAGGLDRFHLDLDLPALGGFDKRYVRDPARGRGSVTMRARGIGLIVLATVALVAAWFLVAPTALGGPMSYVVIFGTSMEPDLHAGDLVGVREGSGYGVGDVVAYDNEEIGQVVLHRIIGRSGDRYVFQGDNNDFVDPYKPRADELIGEMWFQVPGVGAILKRLQQPVPAGILAGLVGLVAIGGASARRRRKGGGRSVNDVRRHHETAEPGLAMVPKTTAAGFAIAVLLSGALAGFVLTRPDTRLTTSRVRYEQLGEFSYSAPAPPGPVYEEDVTTGDPVFLSVLTEIDVALDYRFESAVEHEITAAGPMEAHLTGPNGWHRTWDVTEAGELSGSDTFTGTVDLAQLGRSIEQVERATGVEQQSYELELLAPLQVEGTLAGTEFEDTFDPSIRFTLDDQQLQIQQSDEETVAPVGAPVVSEKTGSLTTATSVPAALELFGSSIDLDLARMAVLILLAVCFVGLLTTGIPWLRAMRQDETSRIRARYGSQLVSARSVDFAGVQSTVEVDTIEALVDLAERFDLPILFLEAEGEQRYLLEGGAALYMYRSASDEPSLVDDGEVDPKTESPV